MHNPRSGARLAREDDRSRAGRPGAAPHGRVAAADLLAILGDRFTRAGERWHVGTWWALPAGVLTILTILRDTQILPVDILIFGFEGRRLFSAAALEVFQQEQMQSGPAQLAFYGVLAMLEGVLRLPLFLLTSAVTQFGATFGVVALSVLPFRVSGRGVPPMFLLLVSFMTAAWGIGSDLHLGGHIAQFLTPVCWLSATVLLQRGRAVPAGVLLALSAGWEPWGVLGIPLLLLAPGRRQAITAGAIAAVGIALLYGPFVLFGDFRMGGFAWPVVAETGAALFLPPGTRFPWTFRVAQGLWALLVAGCLGWRLRASPHALWAVPSAAVAARLVLDPMGFDYYWTPLRLLLFVALGSFLAQRDRRGLLVVPLLYTALMPDLLMWVMALAVLLGTLLVEPVTAAEADVEPVQDAVVPALDSSSAALVPK